MFTYRLSKGGGIMYRLWTPEDRKILQTLWENNIPIKVIKQTLDRTEHAIGHQVLKLGFKRKEKRIPKENHVALKMVRGNSNTVGTISELQVFIELEKKGWTVFPPLVEGNKSDCIIKHYKTGTTHKIQIKTASYNKLDDNYKCDLKGGKEKYKNIDVDYFIIKCDRLDTYYIIPYRFHNKGTRCCLYPHRMKTYQVKKRINTEDFRNKWGVIKQ